MTDREKLIELKPCPFCGDDPHLDRFDIFCDCGAKMEIPFFITIGIGNEGYPTYKEARQELIETWNRRADDGQQRKAD